MIDLATKFLNFFTVQALVVILQCSISVIVKLSTQLTKAYRAEMSCNQIVIDSATYMLRISSSPLLMVYIQSTNQYSIGQQDPQQWVLSVVYKYGY